jgi:enterochelin esterase-like enzyme
MSVNALFRPTFADLRAEVERRAAQDAPADEIATLIEQFLATGGDAPAPWVEYDGTVTWLYRDAAAENVAVIGDIVGYDPDTSRMTRLPGSDLFFMTAQLPLDARAEYVFAVDLPQPEDAAAGLSDEWLRRCKTDPLNPKQIMETLPLRAFSVLEMPNARPLPELDDSDADGIVSIAYQIVGSAELNMWARVWIYLPPDYDSEERRYPTLYLNDGEAYLLSARAPQIMDALLAQGETAPAILVCVQRPERSKIGDRLDPNYVRFLADELVPWVDARYATSTDPQERVIGGASVSATFSLFAALSRPDVFGQVLAQSPLVRSFVKGVPALLEDNAARGFGPPRCYVDVGRYEPAERLESAHTLCNVLLNRGAAVSYQEFGGDHSFLGWRTTLADALRFHFGTPLFPAGLE